MVILERRQYGPRPRWLTAPLRLTGGGRPAPRAKGQVEHGVGRSQANLLACVAGLDRLQTALKHESDRRRQLEREIFDVHAALAQARAELVGTQAGERRARHQALHDGLTSLPNRSFFGERLEHALSDVRPDGAGLAVLYLDLDGFKAINDAHGHDAGDEVLRIVAARLTRAVRAGDVVSRLGGDEFACLLADLMGPEQLNHVARKLFDTVSAPMTLGTLTIIVRPSIGVAIYPADGASAMALLKNADAAMYRAKRSRSGHAFVDRCTCA